MSFWNYLQPKVDVQLNIPQETIILIDNQLVSVSVVQI